MVVVFIDSDFSKTKKGSSIRESVFEFLYRTNSLPVFGCDYTVEEVINYEHGLQGYRLREIQGIFPDGSPITFSSERFLVLTPDEELSENK